MEQHRRWLIGLRLRKLADAGVELDDEARALVDESRPPSPEDEEREEFRVWSGAARWISKKEQIPPGWQKPGLAELVTALQNDNLSAEEFEAIAFVRPCTAYLAVRELASQAIWPPNCWQRLLWAATLRVHEKKLPSHRERHLVDLLSTAPQPLFAEIGTAAADLIERFATRCPPDDEETFRHLWERAWTAISDGSHVLDEDVLTQALNSVPGKLGEAAFHRLWKYDPQASARLPEQLAPYFDAIAVDEAGRLGRVMLAAQLSSLFSIDPAWTKERFLPKMNWAASDEARDLWTAYAWSASAGPNLLNAFKGDLLETFNHYEELGEQRSNLLHLFTAICLEEASAFTTRQIHDVLRALPEDGLVAIGYFLEEQLNGDPQERAEGWRVRIGPWLARHWPSEGERNTTATSLALVGSLLRTGDAFPEAVGWALEFLRLGTDHILWRVQESSLHKNCPDASLDLLIAIVPGDRLPPWECHSLREILDEMREAHPDVEANQKFVTLYHRATA
jgi:hypothetical protein